MTPFWGPNFHTSWTYFWIKFCDAFWLSLGPIWGPFWGPKKAKKSSKSRPRAAKTRLQPKKQLNEKCAFRVGGGSFFGLSRAQDEAKPRPKRPSWRPRRGRKPKLKLNPKWNHLMSRLWPENDSKMGPRMGPKTDQKSDLKLIRPRFGRYRISGFTAAAVSRMCGTCAGEGVGLEYVLQRKGGYSDMRLRLLNTL